ncbi:class I SAM-dependent methyltransferase [bacterium]|nr:class I SAM-dependent methyltransferase [bacterium]
MPPQPDRQSRYWESIEERRPADHPVVLAFAEGVLAAILPHLQEGPVLEVGCGNGFLTRALARRLPVVGVDFSREMLAHNPTTGRIQARAEALPFPDGAFPVVLCQSLLHHCPDPAAVLREMARVSRCCVIAHEPNRNNPAHGAVFAHEASNGAPALGERSRKTCSGRRDCASSSIVRGMILPNKTPAWLLPVAQRLDGGRRA